MSIFDFFKSDAITEPTFVKSDTDAQKQLNALERLLAETPKNALSYLKIQQDIKMLKAGISGEKKVEYELKSSFMPIFIFRDLFLNAKGLTAQIDYLVLHKHFILVVECKKLLGDIEITAKGDFIRRFKTEDGRTYKKEGIYSPVVQNERHCAILKQILSEIFAKVKKSLWDVGVRSVVVVANPKSIVFDQYAKKEIKNQIIKYDQLKAYMQRLAKQNADSFIIGAKSMQKLCDALLTMHTENPVDYTEKYRRMDKQPPEASATEKPDFNTENTALYGALKAYRLETSRKEGIKPYFIFNNAQMDAIIQLHPTTPQELQQIDGFAERKCQKYGQAIVDIVNRFQ